jgi:hypothetical protein
MLTLLYSIPDRWRKGSFSLTSESQEGEEENVHHTDGVISLRIPWVIRVNLNSLQPYFAATTKARLVGVFLLLVALLFSFLWLSEDIPALFMEKIPQTVTESGLLTSPVHVLDLGLYLPATIITAILLWRRKLLGYIFAIPLLVFNILTGIGIVAAQFAASSKGLAASLGVELFIAAIVVVSLVLSVLFLREVK